VLKTGSGKVRIGCGATTYFEIDHDGVARICLRAESNDDKLSEIDMRDGRFTYYSYDSADGHYSEVKLNKSTDNADGMMVVKNAGNPAVNGDGAQLGLNVDLDFAALATAGDSYIAARINVADTSDADVTSKLLIDCQADSVSKFSVNSAGNATVAGTLGVSGFSTTQVGAVINESGADSDTRVEGDTDPNLLFVDAGADRVGIGTASPDCKFQVVGETRIGEDTTNYLKVASNGFVTLAGSAKSKLTMRPTLISGKIASVSKPTAVNIGVHAGYSLPVWNGTVNADEQMFFREYVAGRWDGASDITISVICCLEQAEDVGDKFQLRISWDNKETGSGVVPATSNDVDVETTIATSRNAQYSIYKVQFPVDWDLPTVDVASSDHIGFRLRRIDASALEATGEIIVLDTVITYTVDKMFKAT
jgi:hypothetical protein